MITEICLRSFRSIFADKVSLGPLVTIVGANGSGKSNIVKALEFLSSIAKIGLSDAINQRGGIEGLAPKAVPEDKLPDSEIEIKYRWVHNPPNETYTSDLPPIENCHELTFKCPALDKLEIVKEKLEFCQVLEAVRSQLVSDNPEENKFDLNTKSKIRLLKTADSYEYTFEPKVTDENFNEYIAWFGMDALKDVVKSGEQYLDFLLKWKEFLDQENKKRAKEISFLDPEYRTIVEMAKQADYFNNRIASIRRYDLLLSELRYDQMVTSDNSLSPSGNNLPSVLRRFLSDSENKDAINRLQRSFGEIAPHIRNIKWNSYLSAGREYVEFSESKQGRKIESWESSDGSLRALAILLAVETHPRNSTVIIEEIEQNLHPWAIRSIVSHIREVIKERNLQAILTTHSQQVLEQMRPQEVLVASRNDESGTIFRRIDEIVPGNNIEMGDLGRLWTKGLIGGFPGYDS